MNSNTMTRIAGAAALGAALLIGTVLSAPPAQAQLSSYVVTLTQEGPNVVATGSGTIDVSGLVQIGNVDVGLGYIDPSGAFITTGPLNPPGGADLYTAGFLAIAGPLSFGGEGNGGLASSGSGMPVGIFASNDEIYVPPGYVSGTFLTSTSTWDNTSLLFLGVTPGTYVWAWNPEEGFGGSASASFTLIAGAPEPATLALFAAGLLGIGFARRKRKS